jgi:LAO/AO transport system kinase
MLSVEQILAGNRLALSRLLSEIENDTLTGRKLLSDLFAHTGNAHLVGITGAPGTGKSSLVNRLAHHYRHPPEGQSEKRVAVVAVDPSSPFSGGAVLGDRIRMRDLAGDRGVFIRSMAARGSLGGLAVSTSGVVQAFDAAGFEMVLIETVGAGQAEVDVARLADTTVVVDAPGLGDDIQAIKAGILEIADILVVNKADRPGAEHTRRVLQNMLQMAQPRSEEYHHHGRPETALAPSTEPTPQKSRWLPPVQATIALDGTGIPELAASIQAHQVYLKKSGELQRREQARLQTELDKLLQATLVKRWQKEVSAQRYQQVVDQVVARQLSPRQAVERLLNGGG